MPIELYLAFIAATVILVVIPGAERGAAAGDADFRDQLADRRRDRRSAAFQPMKTGPARPPSGRAIASASFRRLD
jgi:hypothetical protein